MDLRISFENLPEVRAALNPQVYNQALASTIKKLSDQAATQISVNVRKNYAVSASEVKKRLRMISRHTEAGMVPERLLIYFSARISLRHFAPAGQKAKGKGPRIKTARGVRFGASARVYKPLGTKLKKGAFWGRAIRGDVDSAEEASNGLQIFARVDQEDSKSKLGKLTGPSVSQMVRGWDVIANVNAFIADNRDRILENEINHFLAKYRGLR